MSRPDARTIFLLVAALASAPEVACTVFNGKTFEPDAGTTATVDGGGSDGAGHDGAAASCSCAGAALCEEFETASLASSWQTNGTAPILETSRAHCGKGALHVHVPAFGANATTTATLEHAQVLGDARLAGGFFARAWVYVPSSSLLAGDNYFTLIEVRQNADPFAGIGFDVHAAATGITNWTVTPNAVAQGPALPRDKWACVEWQIAYGRDNGASTAWIDGAQAATVTATNTAPTPAYGTFVVGAFFASTAAQPAFDFWIDDVAIDAARVGCER